MGKLIKNHWARLIVLTAATYHLAATLLCYFWPKLFFDFATKTLDGAVKPHPILQTLNLVLAGITLAYEWPLPVLAGTVLHRSLVVRMMWLPLVALAAVLLYQATNAAVYYCLALGVYMWGYCEGEMSSQTHSAAGGMKCRLGSRDADQDVGTGHLRGAVDSTEASGQTSGRAGAGVMCDICVGGG